MLTKEQFCFAKILFFHVSIHLSRHKNGLSMVFLAGKTVISWFLNSCSFVFLCLVYAFQNPVPADFRFFMLAKQRNKVVFHIKSRKQKKRTFQPSFSLFSSKPSADA